MISTGLPLKSLRETVLPSRSLSLNSGAKSNNLLPTMGVTMLVVDVVVVVLTAFDPAHPMDNIARETAKSKAINIRIFI